MANIKIQALPKNIIKKKKKTPRTKYLSENKTKHKLAKTFDQYKNINFTQKQKDPDKQ